MAIFALSALGSRSSTTSGSSAGGGSQAPVAIGSGVSVGYWRVTVEKVEKVSEVEWSGFGNKATPKGVFIQVYVNAENTADKTASINSFDYKLLDSKGAEYAAWTDIEYFMYTGEKKLDNFNTEIPPRTASKLLVVFDVATDATDLTLVIEDKARIKLGNP